MSREKQTEEMADIIYSKINGANFDDVSDAVVALYDAGYRKRRGGEWKLGKSGCMYFCSECNYAAHPREVDEWSYCPRCGAKMKERIAHEQERNAPGE